MKRNVLRRILGAALALVVLVSGAVVARDLLRARRERAAYAALASQVRQLAEREEPASEVDSSSQQEEAPGRLQAYQALAEENPDLIGWVSIPGTGVDYPVLYTPQDPEYYLRRDFYGEYAVSGSIFAGEGWTPGGAHTILYGHNMDDGSMFAALLDYQEEDFAREHSTVRFDTLEEEGEYQVVAAFYSQAYDSQEEGAFRYNQYTDISALVNIQLTKDTDTGEVWISDVSYKPIYMADLYDYGINDYGWHYRMVDLHAAINSYESGSPWDFITDEVYRDMKDALDAVHEFFGADLDSAVKDAGDTADAETTPAAETPADAAE